MIRCYKVQQTRRHRNGMTGRVFYEVRFSFVDWEGVLRSDMIGIVPQDSKSGDCYIIEASNPESGWCCEYFEPQLRRTVADYIQELHAQYRAELAAQS